MKKQQKKLSLGKKTVSVLKANEMLAIKGGIDFTISIVPMTALESACYCESCMGGCTVQNDQPMW